MKLSAALFAAAIYSSRCAASDSPEHAPRAASSQTCSIGLARPVSSASWDVTLYSVAQPQRQDDTIISTLKNAAMGKGESITIKGPPDIRITNVDNAPVFTYEIPELQAPIEDPETGRTKVVLKFEVVGGNGGENATWTTEDCWGGSVVFSAGRESWSCDFPCTIVKKKAREL